MLDVKLSSMRAVVVINALPLGNTKVSLEYVLHYEGRFIR